MKTKFLCLTIVCAVALCAQAQLEVQTSGDVLISKDLTVSQDVNIEQDLNVEQAINVDENATIGGNLNVAKKLDVARRVTINSLGIADSIALNVHASSFATGKSAYGVFGTSNEESFMGVTSGRGIGVIGQVQLSRPHLGDSNAQPRPSFPFYAGVLGIASSGVGVYGTNALHFNNLPKVWSEGDFAGYFQGNVKVTGLLTIPTLSLYIDNRLLQNVTQLNNRTSSDIISQLTPVSYTMSQEDESEQSVSNNTTHYGFIAQEVQQIAPELVQTDKAGNLSINYLELIPLLVQKVQELSAEVETLKNQNK